MSQDNRCMSCMVGTLVNDVCNHCGRRRKQPADRKPYALALNYLLAGRYYIGDVLGCGGFGITYAAWDKQENRRVALKELYPASSAARMTNGTSIRVMSGQESYFSHVYDCFKTEAQLLIQLKGMKGIVEVYDLFEENNTVYYAMEYLDGGDFKSSLQKNGRYTWPQLAPIVQTVFLALDQLHSCNLIHRDISPDNIFITRDGEARLIDFGSVRTYMGNKHFTAFVKQDFAPFEQFKSNGQQGPWTDIYALSVTMYYALSGTLPPRAPDRAMGHEVQPLTKLCPQVPKHVAAAIHQGMGQRPQDRFQNVRQYAQALFPGQTLPWGATKPPSSGGQSHGPQHGHQPGPQQSQQYGHHQPQSHCGDTGLRLICCQGMYRGRQWPLTRGATIRMGRQPQCEIAYPGNSAGISGFQCTIAVDVHGRVLVRDDNSSYGTRLAGSPMQGGRWYALEKGYCISFAREQYIIQ